VAGCHHQMHLDVSRVHQSRVQKAVGSVVATPLWAKWENVTPTPKSGRLGVFRDSQKLRRQFEGSNLLALLRSLYQWKALEV
jgi:hypothetical protein